MKNIVVCCDGTSNNVTTDSTNVLRIFRSLVRNDDQIAYYDSGVGTVADPNLLTDEGKRVYKKLDMAMGHSVSDNVRQAYRFLARTYQPDDRIYLFGFSRGAYAVRALAGMIHMLGLVRPELEHLDRLAWTIYSDDDGRLPTTRRFGGGNRFKSAFARTDPVSIHMVGVWDTVSSFGWFWNFKTLPYTRNNPSISHIRHSVSIDEHRACFPSNPFEHPDDLPENKSFKEIWFAGSHSDVGGGYPEAEDGLAKIALAWMYDESSRLGLVFDGDRQQDFLGQASDKSKPDPAATAHNSTTGVWNLLEFLPRRLWDNARRRFCWNCPNLYRRRTIPNGAVLHESVEIKLKKHAYRPGNLPDEYTFGT